VIKENIYEYNETGIFSLPYTKLATLQDVCTMVGLTLEEKFYSIVEQQTTKNAGTLPFHYKNIVNLSPKSKRMKLLVPKEK
jgi:hypothetical protein